MVKELKMGLGSDFVQGVAIKNSSGKTFDIAKEIQIKPNFKIKNSAEPQVLIVHTHTTEAYMSYYAGYYNEGTAAAPRMKAKTSAPWARPSPPSCAPRASASFTTPPFTTTPNTPAPIPVPRKRLKKT